MGIYCRKYIGGEFKTNQGYTATVIDGGNKNNYCIIDINGWEKEVSVHHLKCGNIKYPYHPNLFGVGYIGDGEYKTKYNKKPSKAYQILHDMITRCYSRKYQIKKPSYKTCTVSKEWHNFQNFAKWFDSNYMEGFVLDKDLLSSCKKIYSKETCVFIPHCLNSFMTNKKSSNKSECIGVREK